MDTYSETNGFHIELKTGDIVDSGEGPPTIVAFPGSMWVPQGTTVNGKLVTQDGSQR